MKGRREDGAGGGREAGPGPPLLLAGSRRTRCPPPTAPRRFPEEAPVWRGRGPAGAGAERGGGSADAAEPPRRREVRAAADLLGTAGTDRAGGVGGL